MSVISRTQLQILAETTLRRALRPAEQADLARALDALFAELDRMYAANRRLAAETTDYEQVIRSQRAELLAARRQPPDSPSPSR